MRFRVGLGLMAASFLTACGAPQIPLPTGSADDALPAKEQALIGRWKRVSGNCLDYLVVDHIAEGSIAYRTFTNVGAMAGPFDFPFTRRGERVKVSVGSDTEFWEFWVDEGRLRLSRDLGVCAFERF